MGAASSVDRGRCLTGWFDKSASEELLAIVKRAGGDPALDPALLECALGDLFRSVGLRVDDTEESEIWREFLESELAHAQLAKLFRRMARSKDPFANKADLAQALPELNAKVRQRSSSQQTRRGAAGRFRDSLRGVQWADLTDDQRADIRQMSRQLARYHQSFVKRGSPVKVDHDTLLDGLATIFADLTHFEFHHYELPHAEESRFIRFAHLALRPLFGETLVSVGALSQRWRRLKNSHRINRPGD